MNRFVVITALSLVFAAPAIAAGASSATRWKSVPLDDGTTAAYVEGTGALRRLVLRCSHGRAELYANTGTMKGEAPVMLKLTGAIGGSDEISLHRDHGTGQWTGTLPDRGIADLLQGHDTRVRSFVDDRDTGSVSLGGSTAAIKAALRTCIGALRAAPAVAQDEPVESDKPVKLAATRTRGKSAPELSTDDEDYGSVSGPLPVKTGYYVARAQACTRPKSVLFYDGKKLVSFDGPDSFSATPAGRFQKKRGDYVYAKLDLTLHVLAPDRIRTDGETTMRLCKTSEIPSKFKP
ncbi:MAG: hypothetical protein M3R41_06990 [Pseudomonadota bacterium]|nr:hypothetical protein [Pseudomonadota bacterium]